MDRSVDSVAGYSGAFALVPRPAARKTLEIVPRESPVSA